MFARVEIGRFSRDREPGFVGAYELRRIGDGRWLTVSYWDADGYEIQADTGETARAPKVVSVMSYEGPLSQLRRDAAAIAWRECVERAMVPHPDFVRAQALWDPVSRGRLVFMMSTSVEGLDRLRQAVDAMPPRIDPVLLPSPDRVELYTVVSAAFSRGHPDDQASTEETAEAASRGDESGA